MANDASGQKYSGRLKVYFMLMESSFEEQMFIKLLKESKVPLSGSFNTAPSS